jgi:hypothetical protein
MKGYATRTSIIPVGSYVEYTYNGKTKHGWLVRYLHHVKAMPDLYAWISDSSAEGWDGHAVRVECIRAWDGGARK